MDQKKLKIFIALWLILFLFLVGLLVFFTLKLAENNRTLKEIQRSVNQINVYEPKDGVNGHTPTQGEIVDLIKPLIPLPIPGSNGSDGKDGMNGVPSKPCTIYTDEENDSYISCPDGTKTLVPKPDQPRQIELCSTPTIEIGWRYVGTITCLKVKGV